MTIELSLADLKKGYTWTYNVEYYTTGYLAGYIQGKIDIFCGEDITPYDAEFLFRVYDPDNGNSNTMVHFSETPTEKQKPAVDEYFTLLTEQLVWYSNMADLKSAIGLENPEHWYKITADEEKPECTFWIDGGDGYTLDNEAGWTIAEALKYHDTDEALAERLESEYRTWCD